MTEAPRWLDVEAAARHVSMRADIFLRAVASKKLPAASYAIGTRSPRWDVHEIDARISGVKDTATVRSVFDGMAAKIAREGPKNRQAQAG